MKKLLEKLITDYNKTHKGQLFIKDDILFHADIAGFAFPLNYFEDENVKTVFERMTKLIDIYQAIDKTKWKNVFILKSNGVKIIIENSDKDEELEVTKRCSKKATYDDLNETIQYLQHKIQCN